MKKKNFLITLLLFAAVVVYGQNGNTTYDVNKSIFKLDNEQIKNANRFLRYAVLSGYREGVAPTKELFAFYLVKDDQAGTQRVALFNLSIQELVSLGIYDPDHVVLEVKDPSRYRYDASQGDEQAWLRKNGYCFQFLLPTSAYSNLMVNGHIDDGLRNQVTAMLGLRWNTEMRMVNGKEMKCLIIKEDK